MAQGNGKLAEQTMIERMGLEQYRQFIIERGRRGGAAPYRGNKGFASNRERARLAGQIGGKASRRTAIKQVEAETKHQDKLKESWRERVGL